MKFSELFENAASRPEVVCTFLALLELIRLKQLVCTQPEAFQEIEITRAQNNPQPEAASVFVTEENPANQPVNETPATNESAAAPQPEIANSQECPRT